MLIKLLVRLLMVSQWAFVLKVKMREGSAPRFSDLLITRATQESRQSILTDKSSLIQWYVTSLIQKHYDQTTNASRDQATYGISPQGFLIPCRQRTTIPMAQNSF